MDMPSQNDSPVRGTKRKYAGDGSEMRDSGNELATIADPTISSPTVTPDTHLVPVPLVPRNDDYFKTLYTKETDFRLLGERDPEFKAVLRHGSSLDFTDPASVMQLTKTLLKLDFGLRVDLPADRLCPPVPNRHNYILWLKDLLDSSAPSYRGAYEPGRGVVGLDVGTGASLVYPLLGCAQRPAWSFVATDVDARSLAYARRNAAINGVQSRVRIVGPRDAAATDPLVPLDELGLDSIDFVMTNPPFYASAAELADLARQKARPPSGACTGAPVEMVYADGGEVGFVRRLVDESLVLRERVQWYTAMLGKQSSLDVLIADLRGRGGVTNYAVTAFVQGSRTRRWAVGWSFGARRPGASASRGCEPPGGKKLLPPSTEATVATWPVEEEAVDSSSSSSTERLGRAVCEAVATLDLVSWSWDRTRSRGLGFADGNVWSRAYRRKKARGVHPITTTSGDGDKDNPASSPGQKQQQQQQQRCEQCAFGFSVEVRTSKDPGETGKEDNVVAVVVVRWLQGNDHVLFESFAGFLRNSLRLP
ncbi:hypothetical protein F4820DRAFT_172294 [Hypoxylon rubiginosum]|uniref:Uncharacterized protein n=1 Tax=Hypoxylon rubiginosum TaxID=110542 RepID=A0ACB9Z944_9PEZI|nr:hypothetical protein F4820DRAFT_172294 [Hypoxylon rubiginosum]